MTTQPQAIHALAVLYAEWLFLLACAVVPYLVLLTRKYRALRRMGYSRANALKYAEASLN
jgi:hypothetical protein